MTPRPALVALELFALPAKWDGRDVAWTKTERPEVIFICPPPTKPDLCPSCGTEARTEIWHGVVTPLPGDTVEGEVIRKTWRSGREYIVRSQEPATAVMALIAFRCPACRHDEVWDLRTDEHWVLDESDYGPDGSTQPTGEPS